MAELWDVYDKNRNATGRLHKRGIKLKNGDFHIICEAWILTSDNKLLLTRRHPDKNYGLLWECTGGAVVAGEDSREGIVREISEEIGLTVSADELTFAGTAEGATFFLDCYILKRDIDVDSLKLQSNEVVGAKLVSKDEFIEMNKNGSLIPKLYEYMKNCDFEFLKG